MGQVVSALMWGVMVDKRLDAKLSTENGPLWDDYEQPKEKQLDYKQAPGHGEHHDCLGFCFAVSNVNEDGEADLSATSFPIGKAGKAFAPQLKRAKKRWQTFAAWLKKQHGVDLPDPEIILTAVERA